MRDLIITAIIFGAIPFILMRPYIGILVWSWIGYMNPHRLTWGFAYSLPFAQVVFIATLLGMLLSKDKLNKLPWSPLFVAWALLITWWCITTLLAIDPASALPKLVISLKIQMVILFTVLAVSGRGQINALIWVIVASLGFYGVKGGLFSLITGGNYRIWGPPETFIYDNNALALALIMIIPLIRYLQSTLTGKWARRACVAAMLLTGLSVLTSFSRGALLAASAMTLFMIFKSKKKIRSILALVFIVPALLLFMPSTWYERMDTLRSYDQENSAMERLVSWEFAIDMALSRPFGGGYKSFVEQNYAQYSPSATQKIMESKTPRFQDAHSIYFEMLGEHGFIGLFLFLAVLALAFTTARSVVKAAGNDPELAWAKELANMLQISIVGYSIGGAFLSLAYYDLIYHFIAIIMLLNVIVQTHAVKKREHSPAATYGYARG